jgi:hypothetical protein
MIMQLTALLGSFPLRRLILPLGAPPYGRSEIQPSKIARYPRSASDGETLEKSRQKSRSTLLGNEVSLTRVNFLSINQERRQRSKNKWPRCVTSGGMANAHKGLVEELLEDQPWSDQVGG